MKELICIVCPKGCRLKVDEANGYQVTGNACPRGVIYGQNEVKNPQRTLTSTVRIRAAALPRCPVKTDRPIAKKLLFAAMQALDEITLHAPVQAGDIVVADLAGSGANLIVTRDMAKAENPQ